jgi:hypothetical protein
MILSRTINQCMGWLCSIRVGDADLGDLVMSCPTYAINRCFELWTTNYLGLSGYLGQGVWPIRIAYH